MVSLRSEWQASVTRARAQEKLDHVPKQLRFYLYSEGKNCEVLISCRREELWDTDCEDIMCYMKMSGSLVMLPCGHVFLFNSIQRMATSRRGGNNSSFKCPTCPKELTLNEVFQVHFI